MFKAGRISDGTFSLQHVRTYYNFILIIIFIIIIIIVTLSRQPPARAHLRLRTSSLPRWRSVNAIKKIMKNQVQSWFRCQIALANSCDPSLVLFDDICYFSSLDRLMMDFQVWRRERRRGEDRVQCCRGGRRTTARAGSPPSPPPPSSPSSSTTLPMSSFPSVSSSLLSYLIPTTTTSSGVTEWNNGICKQLQQLRPNAKVRYKTPILPLMMRVSWECDWPLLLIFILGWRLTKNTKCSWNKIFENPPPPVSMCRYHLTQR